MAWEKRGLIFKPSGESSWMKTHAQIPTALLLDDRIRVYIATRPEQQISIPTFIDVDIEDPTQILAIHDRPILEFGGSGEFDQFGIMPSCAMHVGDEVWLYYGGWNRGVEIPNQLATGLAISKDGGKTFEKPFAGPLLASNRFHPFSLMAVNMLRHDDNTWHMWYGATRKWEKINERWEQTYNIYHGESVDGINWQLDGKLCIPKSSEDECTIRPAVIYENDLYHMWFSHRKTQDYYGGNGSYRMGYATSKDGKTWERDDRKAGIELSEDGWDSKMISYPNIVDTPHGRYMFYNGNDFGIEGFGYAVWQE
ncbi:MAG: hypothetical protein ACN2B6_10020 [Rickettsiales bacterium]